MGLFSSHSTPERSANTYKVALSQDEWRERLSREEYQVLRQGGTERAFTGEYTATRSPGTYVCRGCAAPLFTATTKFDAHCGWPAFYAPKDNEAVELLEDSSMGMKRIEVRCAACGSHLGHVFEGEGYDTPTDQRYCINSICLDLIPERSAEGASAPQILPEN